MGSFEAFGLFDPNSEDEEQEEEMFLSASEILERKKLSKKAGKLPRSNTDLHLKKTSTVNQSMPRSNSSLDLKKTIKEHKGLIVKGVGRSRTFSAPIDEDYNYLPPEPQMGNIEYKLKLVNPSATRLEHLVTQMKWRLREGAGEAIYEMGVEDNGIMTGLSEEDMDKSLETLQEMARRLGATVQVLRQNKDRSVAEILVRKVPDDQQVIDLRVCVLGSADVGKSTLLGVLTQGELDNGRGRARLNMFRHLHEIQTGRTSSISHEILGFDCEGNSVDYQNQGTAENICENSSKLITFIDLAGHQKYLRTTISALTGYCPHYVSTCGWRLITNFDLQVMLVVSATAGVVGMTQEHLGIAVALEVPFFVVITKVDMVPPAQLKQTINKVTGILKSAGAKKVPLLVVTSDDCITAASNSLSNNTVPVFCVSSVTGDGLTDVKQYLHLLPPGVGQSEANKLDLELPEFQLDELFDVPGVGTVAGGLVTQGIIVENMPLNVGPFDDGSFRTVHVSNGMMMINLSNWSVKVSSIRRNKAACRLVRAQQSAALALDIPLSQLRRGE